MTRDVTLDCGWCVLRAWGEGGGGFLIEPLALFNDVVPCMPTGEC